MSCANLDRDLDAYVDGELDADATATVRAHLQSCARCLERVAEREALVRLVQAMPYYDAPAHLRSEVARRAARTSATRRFVAAAAAAVLVVAGSAAVVHVAAQAGRGEAVVLVDAHVQALAAGHLVDVRSTDQHTVKPWFAGRLEYSPPVTDLTPIGFPLVGGRVDSLRGRAVAALVYQHRLHVINVFVAPAGAGWWSRPSAYQVRGFHVRHWTSQDMSFWAVSDLNDAELADLARALGG